MPIPLSAPDIGETEIRAVVEVLRSGQLSLGPRLPAFEAALARYVGTPHAIATNSGTSALHLALKGLRVGPGDEVITPSFSFVAPANAILMVGARPILAEIDPQTLNLDPAAVAASVTPRTRAILVVHLFGRPAPMEALLKIAREHQLLVVEDACEAIGARIHERAAGSLGDAGVFGFYPNKAMTTGEGGALVTPHEELARRAARGRNQGRDPTLGWFEHRELGYNYRLSELHAALGLVQLERLEAMLLARARVARGYHERLQGHPLIQVPNPACEGGRLAWFVYVIRLRPPLERQDRDRIWRELGAQGIQCGRYFAPIHLQPFMRERFGDQQGLLPITERAGDTALALPFFNRLREEQMDRVCRALLHSLDQRKAAFPGP